MNSYKSTLLFILSFFALAILASCAEPKENRVIISQKEVVLSNQNPVVEIQLISKQPWQLKSNSTNDQANPNQSSDDQSFLRLGHWIAVTPISGKPNKDDNSTQNFKIRIAASRSGFTDREYEDEFYIESGNKRDTIHIKVLPR